MKPGTLIASILSAGLGAWMFNASGADAAAVQFVNQDLQLGALTNGQTVAVTFVLTNNADKVVKIAAVDSSCKCTTLQNSPAEIPAHGSGAFEWTFNSSRTTGEVTQTVEVSTADGQTITGQFHASVAPPSEAATLQVSTNTTTPPATTRKGGISGPGKPLAPGEKWTVFKRSTSNSAVTQGILPPIRPLLDLYGADARADAPWVPDRGDGTYQNPVLFADYSDPDAVRVGDDFYLIASSFLTAPGLPILHSKDLVNWTIINHVFTVQPPADHFSLPRHGEGVWAPAIRHHDGKFWIFYPDPDFGIYLSTATNAAGQWTPPRLVKAGKGLIDPCPFWDDDGQLYLVHGWARSRAGIANLLTLHKLSADGAKVLDEGKVIIDGAKIPNWTTLEGPKVYKRHGYYYVFAPSGGVTSGYQAVFRSKNIYGPYEHRIVLDQGKTVINGPHQGAWVDTPKGEDWFLHFQDRGAYGRVVHLEPMVWRDDDWPVIGADPDGDGKGEPVLVHAKPNVGRTYPITTPQTSDEFDGQALGLQWQWNANPRDDWASFTARPGFLRLTSVPAPKTRNNGAPATNSIYDAPNFLLQKFPAPEFTVTTKMQFAPAAEGEFAGLTVFGFDYAWLGLRRAADGLRLVYGVNQGANRPGAQEREVAGVAAAPKPVYLRVSIGQGAVCRFAYSFDNQTFTSIGEPFRASGDRWIGAKVGVVASAPPSAAKTGYAEFDWFHVTATSVADAGGNSPAPSKP